MPFVPSKPPRSERIRYYCEDAIEAIDSIRTYVDGMGFEEYNSHRMTQSAVERELLILAEIVSRIPEFEDAYEQAYKIRGVGNRLRHEYERISNRIVWEAITGLQLEELRSAFVAFSPRS
jgi:uncharacterized protein with HEPN domain